LCLGLALLVTGCGSNIIAPKNQLEVTNVTDSFQWQASALSVVTQTLTYIWVNTGTTANVHQSSRFENGVARLQVSDDGGTEVYSRVLNRDGDFVTAAGTPGNWTITLTLNEVDGRISFRLQQP